MKHHGIFAQTLAIAIAGMMTACSLDSYEPEKPFTTCPEPPTTLYACGVSETETRSAHEAGTVLFTEDDIEWFDATTREIKFREMDEPLYKRLEPFRKIVFFLGDRPTADYMAGSALFIVSSFVTDWDSRIYTGLVLHYDVISDLGRGHYYLQNCYPENFINLEEVKANIQKNAGQWELFIRYLESKGKLR